MSKGKIVKAWGIIFKFVISIIGLAVIGFNVLLYNFCEQQKSVINAISDQQKVESQVDNNKFKYQQEQVERISKDLEDALQQIKDQNNALADQKDALLREAEQREQLENESKGAQTSLVDIKAESDAIKQDMKSWQKDYVTVLAQLDKKMDDSQDEIKSIKDNLDSLDIPKLKENINSLKADVEKMANPPDNALSSTPSAPDKNIDQMQSGTQ